MPRSLPLPALGLFALLTGLAQPLLATPGVAADLTVTVSGVKATPAPTTIRMALYNDAKSFRHEPQALQVISVPAAEGSVSGVFHNIAPGRYAVLAYHDENGNGKLDLLLGMFPSEGWGLSNDPSVLGPPGFDASAFDVAEPGGQLTMPLHY